MDTSTPFPYIPRDLIDELAARYPDRSPNPSDSEREIWMKAGEQRLRRFLEGKYNDQLARAAGVIGPNQKSVSIQTR